MEFTGDFGRGGCVVDKHRTPRNAMEGTIPPKRDFAQVVVVADAGHDEVLALCGRPGCRRGTTADLRHPLLCLGCGPVVDGDVVAAFDFEVTGHRVAHHAESEKRNLCHEDPSL